MNAQETRKAELAYISQLENEYNLNDPREVLALFHVLQTNGYKFTTREGIAFDDDIYERAQEYKKQGYSAVKPSGRERNSAQNTRAKQRTRLERIDVTGRDRTSGNGKTIGRGSADGSRNASGRGIVRDKVYEKDLEIEIKRQLKKRERIRRSIVLGCLATALACSSVFLYYYYVAEKTQRQYEQLAELIDYEAPQGAVSEITNSRTFVSEEGVLETVTLSVLDKYETLYNKNHNLIGWLTIADTVIDYPVTQTSETDYYLNHNFYGETDSNGCIFMDPDCDVINRSDNLILYGHHMKSGNMFGNLDRYSKYEYYLEHPTIQFDTIYEEGTYQVMYVFRSRIYNEDEVVFKYYQFINANSAEEFDSYMNEMAQMSLYDTGVTAGYGDDLITLSTCDYREKNGRFVVVARRV